MNFAQKNGKFIDFLDQTSKWVWILDIHDISAMCRIFHDKDTRYGRKEDDFKMRSYNDT